MNKEDLRDVDGSDSLHPNRSGDVVVVTRPPYQSDAGTNGQVIALSHFFGQHGYLPDYVDLANNINMHAVFVMAGPTIKHLSGVEGLRAVDVAPTLSFLMGIPGPQNARGAILYDLINGTANLTEVTLLNISDWHGQIPPLLDAADNLPGDREPDLCHRRLRVPQALVRYLHRGSPAVRRIRRRRDHARGG